MDIIVVGSQNPWVGVSKLHLAVFGTGDPQQTLPASDTGVIEYRSLCGKRYLVPREGIASFDEVQEWERCGRCAVALRRRTFHQRKEQQS